MNKLYLISFDNGYPYEDNSHWPVLVCNSREKAINLISEWTEWVKIVAKDLPPELDPNAGIPEDEWDKRDDEAIAARSMYVDNLNFPSEVVKGELITMIYERDSIYRGHFVLAEVDYIYE